MVEKYFDINREGHSIKCKLYCKDIHIITQVVIAGHGFGGHKDNKINARFAEHVISKSKKTAVLTFDLPAHGDDVKKRVTLEDCDTYITFVIDYIKERFKTERIYMYATSFSGYLTLKYIHEHPDPFVKIALRAPAVEIDRSFEDDLSDDDYNALAKGKDVPIGHGKTILINQHFLDGLKENNVSAYDYIEFADDILLIQGTKDEFVSTEAIQHFSEENVIELILVENADHRFQDQKLLDYAISCIIKFLDL